MAIPDEIKEMRDKAWDAHKRGDNLDAIKLYNELLKIDPNPGLVYSYRATAYIGLKDYEQAIQDCNKGIELYPTYSEVYNNRGWAYLEMGNYEQAINDFSTAIKRKKNNHIAYTNRACAYLELKKYEQAIDDCNKVIEEFNPKAKIKAEAYYVRSECYKALGEESKAQADFVKAKQLGYNK
ncbi:MAG: tetratricopeptide repeat protein [Selenomonadaceae bacterium]|nr:tetratricopeptide repeat protein [Selenomonadaceae bacterium]